MSKSTVSNFLRGRLPFVAPLPKQKYRKYDSMLMDENKNLVNKFLNSSPGLPTEILSKFEREKHAWEDKMDAHIAKLKEEYQKCNDMPNACFW